MLEVTLYRDRDGRTCGLQARGHTDFAEYGEDIVCAAVSAILQAAVLGLAEHAGVELTTVRQPGRLDVGWPPEERGRESVRAIVAAAELAIDQIAARFPKHVRLKRVTKPANRRRNHDV